MRKGLVYLFMLGGIVCIVCTVVAFSSIYHDVEMVTKAAQLEYQLPAVESLTALVCSHTHSIAMKNSAIWSLGQFAEERTLPFLEKLYSDTVDSEPCVHKDQICKREIEKAIKWCRHGNMTSWMYWRINI